MSYAAACALQQQLAERRKAGAIPDQLLAVEHPHVITLGRNAQAGHVLAPAELLAAEGIEVHETDRGGDVTYHGPGQVVGYPILDLKEWKRDVGAYVRALEQVLIDALAGLGIGHAGRVAGMTGVWVDGRKVAAIGVHLSRWVTTHGFALNVDTDLNYFRHIIPCGLTRPVTSLRELGCGASRREAIEAIKEPFARNFGLNLFDIPTEKIA